jgi:hypothetical protein
MPKLAIYFTIVLASIAVIVSVVFRTIFVIGFYQATN